MYAFRHAARQKVASAGAMPLGFHRRENQSR
jgi:hypothetical protein